MTSQNMHVEKQEALVAVARQVQQGLLAIGYGYVAGDADAWPMTDVIMSGSDGYLVVALWDSAHSAEIYQRWARLAARMSDVSLLLIGIEPPTAESIERFFHATEGTIAYLDAVSRYYRVRHLSGSLDNTLLASLLDARRVDSGIDPREVMREQIAAVTADDEQNGNRSASPLPYVTYSIIALCCVLFLLMLWSGGVSGLLNMSSATAKSWGALYGPSVRQGEVWRIISVMFLHGSLLHLLMNMLALYYFGSLLERWLGGARFSILYLFGGVTGALMSLWWNPTVTGVGASGAIFGLLGAMLAIYARFRSDFPPLIRRQYISWLKQLLLLNLFFSLMPGIDMAAHVGGLIGGLVLGLIMATSPYQQKPTPRWMLPAAAAVVAVTAWIGSGIIARIPLSM